MLKCYEVCMIYISEYKDLIKEFNEENIYFVTKCLKSSQVECELTPCCRRAAWLGC